MHIISFCIEFIYERIMVQSEDFMLIIIHFRNSVDSVNSIRLGTGHNVCSTHTYMLHFHLFEWFCTFNTEYVIIYDYYYFSLISLIIINVLIFMCKLLVWCSMFSRILFGRFQSIWFLEWIMFLKIEIHNGGKKISLGRL